MTAASARSCFELPSGLSWFPARRSPCVGGVIPTLLDVSSHELRRPLDLLGAGDFLLVEMASHRSLIPQGGSPIPVSAAPRRPRSLWFAGAPFPIPQGGLLPPIDVRLAPAAVPADAGAFLPDRHDRVSLSACSQDGAV